jgi:tetratricopeptide (TPR) repeat protein
MAAALSEAEHHYRLALKLAQVLSNPAREAEAANSLGHTLVGAGRWQEARSVLTQALNKYRDLEDLDGEARAAKAMTGVNESPQEGLERLQPLLERLERRGSLENYPWLGGSPGHGWLYEALAYLLEVAGRHDEALAAAERAIAIAKSPLYSAYDAHGGGNKWLQRSAENRCAGSLIELGRVDEGLALLETIIGLPVKNMAARSRAERSDMYGSDTVSFPDLQSAFSFAAQAYASKGDLGRAKTYVVEALSLSEEYGVIMGVAHALGEVAYISSLQCAWSDVRTHLDRLEVILKTTDLQWDRPKELRLLVRGLLHFSNGESDQASEFIHEGMSVRERWGETVTLPLFYEVLAELELMRGNARLAQGILDSAISRSDISERHRTSLMILLAWAHLDLGESAEARVLAVQAADQARDHGTRLYLADALCAKGLAESRLGLATEAGHSLEAAVELARSMDYGRGEGRAVYAQALADLERGDLPRAKTRLRSALAVFERLSLQPYIVKTQRTLSGLV